MSDTPLELVQTIDLLTEVFNRFDECLFVGYKDHSDTSDHYQIALMASAHGGHGLVELARKAAEANERDSRN